VLGALFQNIFSRERKETAKKILKSRMLNGAFWRYLKRCFSVGTAEKIKSRTLNSAFWRYLKRCFGSWNSAEKVLKAKTPTGAI